MIAIQSDNIAALFDMYEKELKKADDAISRLEQSPTVCRKGCNYCCYQAVGVSSMESLVIEEYIKTHFTPLQRALLKGKVLRNCKKLIKNGITSKSLINLQTYQDLENLQRKRFPLQIKCPFNKNGACSIYSHRPIACLTFRSYGSSQGCKNLEPHAKTIYYEAQERQIRSNIYNETGFSFGFPVLLDFVLLGIL